MLTRVVRPIELSVLLELVAMTREGRQTLVNTYKERIWASYGQGWSAVDLSKHLEEFMYEGTGAKMGARGYRHFAIAVQRHFPGTNYKRYETGAVENATLACAFEDSNLDNGVTWDYICCYALRTPSAQYLGSYLLLNRVQIRLECTEY